MIQFNWNKIFLTSLLLLIFTASLYPGNDADALLKKVQKKYETWKDAKISFTQEVKFSVTKTEQLFIGTLIMKKGSRYRIELEDRNIITDGISVWSINKTNKQVVIDKYHDDPKALTPEKVLTSIPKKYNASILNKEEDADAKLTVLKLLPKEERSSFKSIKMWIDEDKMLIKKIQILDSSNNTTTYIITDLEVDAGIPDSYFVYKPESGYEIIDLR
ncbi:MAG: outer membrane lipoprotein carrier protein LolA [Ignavibacteriales bacterium]|nr:outer membrane lipoprotein carrier protein LolA [Ignavibacteriales bacterium]